MTDKISFVGGGLSVDDRGRLRFCNDFDMTPVKRLYVVSNHAPQFIRAWHAHKNETKFAYVASGSALFGAVKVDDWTSPDRAAEVPRFTLSEAKPGILEIPGGFAHGFKTLEPGTRVFFFSTSTMEQSLEDDYRYPFDYWDPWEVVAR